MKEYGKMHVTGLVNVPQTLYSDNI